LDGVYGTHFWHLPGLMLTMADTLTAIETPALILDMDKAERLMYGHSLMTHAMVFTGVRHFRH